MKKILVYENRKCGPATWDISTPLLEEKAFRELFKILKNQWKVYYDLEHPSIVTGCDHECKHHKPITEESTNPDEVEIYKKAKTGDIKAIRRLLRLRQDYEYEEWRIEEVR